MAHEADKQEIAASSTGPYYEEPNGFPGKWVPQSLGPFQKGTQKWHKYITDHERQLICDELTKVIADPKTSNHHRLLELKWFARQLELHFYQESTTKDRYFVNIGDRLPIMRGMIKNNEEWTKMISIGDIPFIDALEKLYLTKSKRFALFDLDYDEELNVKGGPMIKLVKKDQFNTHHCHIEPRTTQKIIEPERKPRDVNSRNRKAMDHTDLMIINYQGSETKPTRIMTLTSAMFDI